jgi:hypothetical protein
MKTKSIDLNVEEAGLMCNLLYTAMRASGKVFADQPTPVKNLSAKLARCHAKLSGHKLKPMQPNADTVTDAVAKEPAE